MTVSELDLDTGAVVAVTLQGADLGDAVTLDATLSEAGMAVASPELPSAQYESLGTEKTPSSRVLCESGQGRSMICTAIKDEELRK